MLNPYEVLGVNKDTSPEEIKKAYHQMALKYHPDRNPGNKEAEEKSKDINVAYDILSDPEKKSNFDRFGSPDSRQGPTMDPFSGFGGFGFNPFAGGFGFMNPNAPRQGQNIGIQTQVSLFDSIFGCVKHIEYQLEQECDKCLVPCAACGGKGMSVNIQRGMMTSTTCHSCGGRGKLPNRNSSCPSCRGSGSIVDNRKAEINIPAGVKEGSKLGVRGGGMPGMNGGPPGDLIVVVQVSMPNPTAFSEEEKHRLFDIIGNR